MKIAVMGSGGIGGYFGGRLAAAGADIAFIARGDHGAAMAADGIRIISPLGDAHISPVRVTADPAEIGPVDVVMFAVKLYDCESAAELCRPFLKADTAVISFLNGIDSEAIIARVLGAEHSVGGIAYIPADIREPGVISHNAPFASLAFGEMDGRASPRLDAFLQVCQGAGIDTSIRDNIAVALWDKFVMLASLAAVTSLTRQPARAIHDDADIGQLCRDAVEEGVAVARAKDIGLAPDTIDKVMATIAQFPPTAQSSMLTDLERGKPLELEWFSGTIARLGAELGVPTPIHRTTYAALKPYAKGAGS
jgi:2-dehydropantoate 2-reductase